jgi:hypothetical protein
MSRVIYAGARQSVAGVCKRSVARRPMSAQAQADTETLFGIFPRNMIPKMALAVGFFGLSFQILVLHPFHENLSDQFNAVVVSDSVSLSPVVDATPFPRPAPVRCTPGRSDE